LDEASIVGRIVGRDEPAWFGDLIAPKPSNSIASLAAALGAGWEYDFLYEAWSAFAHGRGISKDISLQGSSAEIHHPHRPTWFSSVAFFSLFWQGLLLLTAAKWLCPGVVPQLQDLHRRFASVIPRIEFDELVFDELID
jgi:hypothetical protein